MLASLPLLLIFMSILITSAKCKPSHKPKENQVVALSDSVFFPELSEDLVNDLELLGKMWGMMKYHHKKIASGNCHWDYELIKFLPQYLTVGSIKERDELLLNWIDSYGEISVVKNKISLDSTALLLPDQRWLQSIEMSDALRNKLKMLFENRSQHSNHYVSIKNGLPIHQEEPYSNIKFPNTSMRLLALFRFWNIIQYYYPYRNLTDNYWGDVLKDYIPVFITASNEKEYHQAIFHIVAELDDTHAFMHSVNTGKYLAPYKLRFIEGKLIITDYYSTRYADTTLLKKGTEIVSVNGMDISSICDSLQKVYSASNEAAFHRQVAFNILRTDKDKISIGYSTDSTSFSDTTIQNPLANDCLNDYWSSITQPNELFTKLNDTVGYANMSFSGFISRPDIEEFVDGISHLIVDFRHGISLHPQVENDLLDIVSCEKIPYVKYTFCNQDTPGEFSVCGEYETSKCLNCFDGKIRVLIDENVQSHGEFVTMYFKALPNAKVIGSTTAGSDGNVTSLIMPGNITIQYTGIGIYYPDGTGVQRVGIIPDIFVETNIESVLYGKDNVLEAALKSL